MTAGLPTIQRHPDEGVAVVRWDRPPLNLLTAAVRERLIVIAAELAEDAGIRAVLLQGGGRCFSAGSDIHEFPDTIAAGRRRARLEHRCANAFEQLPQPVIAALHGPVLGGGLELALACDLRIAADDSTFGFPEIRLGVFPSGGGTFRARRAIGNARTAELMLLGDSIDAEHACRIGLVNRLVPAERLQNEGFGWAREIAARPALAARAVKETLRTPEPAAQDTEEHLIAELFTSHDAREGVSAFLDKRAPRFEHR